MEDDLVRIRGVGPETASRLVRAGIKDIEQLAKSTPEQLAFVKGIGTYSAKKMIKQAQGLIKFEEGLSIVLDHIKKSFEEHCPKCGGEMVRKMIILGPERRINARQCRLCKFYLPN